MADDDTRPHALMMPETPLAALKPQWLYHKADRRYGMGFSMDCPLHPWATHRLEFWFIRPMDGDPPPEQAIRARALYDHVGGNFMDLTVWTARPYRDQCLTSEDGHWKGYILEGRVYSAPRGGGL